MARRGRFHEIRMTAEDLEQAAVINWARCNTDLWPELAYLFHVPNGGLRAHDTAVRLKILGALAGVSDLILLVPRGGFHGLVLEMKAIGAHGRQGVVSPAQKAFLDFVQRQGYATAVCYDRFAAIETLKAYLVSGLK